MTWARWWAIATTLLLVLGCPTDQDDDVGDDDVGDDDSGDDDAASSSVYTSVDAGVPDRMVLVVINKAGTAQWAHVQVNHTSNFSQAEVNQQTSGSAFPAAAGTVGVWGNELWYEMPAQSASTLVLLP